MRRQYLLFLLLSVAVMLGAYVYTRETSPTFITVPVERGTIATFVKATGSVDAVITVDVSSQLSGRISEVFVNFNDQVKAGQPIARVDPEIFAARVSEAKAILQVAKANTQLQEAALRRAKVAIENASTARKMAELQLASAQSKQDDLERDYQRNLGLTRVNAVSDREFTLSRTQRDAGAINLRAQAEDINMKALAITIAEAEFSMAEANLHNAEAVVEQRQAALEQAELDLARTVIRTPIDGVIIKRDVNPGQTVAVTLEAKTLFKIAQDLREMELRGRIDEADVGKLQVGQSVRFTVDAYSDRVFSGRVLQIRKSPEVVQNVVTYTAVISAPNPDLLLLPGMTATLKAIISETGETLKIPNQALRYRPAGIGKDPSDSVVSGESGTGTVWVVDGGGSARPLKVKLGASDESGAAVLDGTLQEGQQLIVGAVPPQNRMRAFGLRLGF
jgi:HlyD family secretion protein